MGFLFCIDVVSRQKLVYNRFHFDMFRSDVIVLLLVLVLVLLVLLLVVVVVVVRCCCCC